VIVETVPAALDGQRLDRIVALVADVSRSDAAVVVAAGGVEVDGEVATSGKVRLVEGQQVTVDTAHVPTVALPVADPTWTSRSSTSTTTWWSSTSRPGSWCTRGRQPDGTLVNGLLARSPTSPTWATRCGRASCTVSTPGAPDCSWWPAPDGRRAPDRPVRRPLGWSRGTSRWCGVIPLRRTA
jgi:hypothetical protein